MKNNQELLGSFENPQQLVNRLENLAKQNHLKHSLLSEIKDAFKEVDFVKEQYKDVISDLFKKIDNATNSFDDLVNMDYSVSVASDLILESES